MKYPKFFLLLVTIIAAYFIYTTNQDSMALQGTISSLGLFGAFLAGVLYVYSFTAAPATSILLIIGFQNSMILTGLVAGLGALFGDLLIYRFVSESFDDELKLLSKEKFFVKFKNSIPDVCSKCLLPIVAVIFIGSPLPDEIGELNNLSEIKLISFINT